MSNIHYPSGAEQQADGGSGGGRLSPLQAVRPEDLKASDPQLFELLDADRGMEGIRQGIFSLLTAREAELFSYGCEMESMQRSNALHCIRILKNVFSRRSERISGHSTLYHLIELVRAGGEVRKERKALFLEIYFLSIGTLGRADMAIDEAPSFLHRDGREAARIRSDFLDVMAQECEERMRSYRNGLEPEVVRQREGHRQRILDLLGGTMDDWNDHRWQQRNVFTDLDAISRIIDLSDDEAAAIKMAKENRLPFGITPYYLSLFDREPSRRWDHAVRAQVIPPLSYVRGVLATRGKEVGELDFMKEGQTSPVDLVTRRYPMIAILKPYNTCAQICVYCQRNWEIGDVTAPQALASRESIDEALQWFRDHPTIYRGPGHRR